MTFHTGGIVEVRVRKGDNVRPVGHSSPLGVVKRAARDGSWADVRWKGRDFDGVVYEWTRRFHTSKLVVLVEDVII